MQKKWQYSGEGNRTLSKVHQQGEQTRVGWNVEILKWWLGF